MPTGRDEIYKVEVPFEPDHLYHYREGYIAQLRQRMADVLAQHPGKTLFVELSAEVRPPCGGLMGLRFSNEEAYEKEKYYWDHRTEFMALGKWMLEDVYNMAERDKDEKVIEAIDRICAERGFVFPLYVNAAMKLLTPMERDEFDKTFKRKILRGEV